MYKEKEETFEFKEWRIILSSLIHYRPRKQTSLMNWDDIGIAITMTMIVLIAAIVTAVHIVLWVCCCYSYGGDYDFYGCCYSYSGMHDIMRKFRLNKLMIRMFVHWYGAVCLNRINSSNKKEMDVAYNIPSTKETSKTIYSSWDWT